MREVIWFFAWIMLCIAIVITIISLLHLIIDRVTR